MNKNHAQSVSEIENGKIYQSTYMHSMGPSEKSEMRLNCFLFLFYYDGAVSFFYQVK